MEIFLGGVSMQEQTLELENVAMILKLLGDKTRLTILKLLETNDCCVCEFVSIFKMSQPAISQHLRKLKDARLVKESRRGQWIIYSLNRDSEYFNFVQKLLQHLPSQSIKLQELDEQGLRISCE